MMTLTTYLIAALTITMLQACGSTHAYWPDGTLVFSNKPHGIVGRIATRITGGDQFTHVGIVFGGRVYESDFPRATSTPVSQYGKRGTTNDYYVPTQWQDTRAMYATALSMIGQPYGLRGYIKPVRNPDLWCSPFVGHVMNAGGAGLSSQDYHEPQNIFNRLHSTLRFGGRVTR